MCQKKYKSVGYNEEIKLKYDMLRELLLCKLGKKIQNKESFRKLLFDPDYFENNENVYVESVCNVPCEMMDERKFHNETKLRMEETRREHIFSLIDEFKSKFWPQWRKECTNKLTSGLQYTSEYGQVRKIRMDLGLKPDCESKAQKKGSWTWLQCYQMISSLSKQFVDKSTEIKWPDEINCKCLRDIYCKIDICGIGNESEAFKCLGEEFTSKLGDTHGMKKAIQNRLLHLLQLRKKHNTLKHSALITTDNSETTKESECAVGHLVSYQSGPDGKPNVQLAIWNICINTTPDRIKTMFAQAPAAKLGYELNKIIAPAVKTNESTRMFSIIVSRSRWMDKDAIDKGQIERAIKDSKHNFVEVC